jgi:Phosphoenolpyruvate phosphomutase
MTQQDKAGAFRSLHVPGTPLVLFNAWDAGSAKAVAKADAAAIATGSWSIAAANGLPDGEKVDRSLHLKTIESIAGAVDLPVTADLESGFSQQPEGVGETVRLAIEAVRSGATSRTAFPRTAACVLSRMQSQGTRPRAPPRTRLFRASSSMRVRTCSFRNRPRSIRLRWSKKHSNAAVLMLTRAPTDCSWPPAENGEKWAVLTAHVALLSH